MLPDEVFRSAEARQRYAEVLAALPDTVVALDYDGTLAPIVDDPTSAEPHPGAAEVLVDLARRVRAVAVITGRPARQVLALGGLDEVGGVIGDLGRELYLFGQYGNERWSSTNRRVISPRPPHGLSGFLRDLPTVLRRHGAADAYVEEKGLAVAIHTRRLPDPDASVDQLSGPVAELADRYGLAIEPGKQVLEVRSPGMHKGLAVHTLVEELDAGGFVFAGDDLGDLEAFAAVDELTDKGLATLKVCSHSREESALDELADLVVPGPTGVMVLLRSLVASADPE